MVHPDNGIVFNTKKKRKETKNHQAMKRHVNMLGHFSCVWLFATLWNVAQQGSSVHGILQARTLEWIAMPFYRGSSQPGIEPTSPALAGEFFTTSATWEALKRHGGTLKAYCQMNEASLKRLHIVWFQIYDILVKAKLWRQWKDQWLSGLGRRKDK